VQLFTKRLTEAVAADADLRTRLVSKKVALPLCPGLRPRNVTAWNVHIAHEVGDPYNASWKALLAFLASQQHFGRASASLGPSSVAGSAAVAPPCPLAHHLGDSLTSQVAAAPLGAAMTTSSTSSHAAAPSMVAGIPHTLVHTGSPPPKRRRRRPTPPRRGKRMRSSSSSHSQSKMARVERLAAALASTSTTCDGDNSGGGSLTSLAAPGHHCGRAPSLGRPT
jgi:hypothetical protein